MAEKMHHGYAVEATYDPNWPYDGDPVGIWCARVIGMPGCLAQGHTKSEALSDLDKHITYMQEHAESHGRTLPEPDLPECLGGLEIVNTWDGRVRLTWTSVSGGPDDADG